MLVCAVVPPRFVPTWLNCWMRYELASFILAESLRAMEKGEEHDSKSDVQANHINVVNETFKK